MSRVLITGSTGFLGRHLAELCIAQGDEVTGTHRTHGAVESRDNLQYVKVDLEDRVGIAELVGRIKPDVVYHLAAQSSTSVSRQEPERTFRENVQGTLNVLEACSLSHRPKGVMIASTSDVYGWVGADENPVSETHPTAPTTPYACSKLAAETVATYFRSTFELAVTVIRPFLQIGPGRSDLFFAGAFARQVVEASRRKQDRPIIVGNIDLVRDMTDVRDVASACRLLMQQPRPETYNIATGNRVALRSLLEAMMDCAGVRVEVHENFSEPRRDEPEVLIGDSSRLQNATGWRPIISLEQSARDMIVDWQKRLSSVPA